jgi:hypothetical protein
LDRLLLTPVLDNYLLAAERLVESEQVFRKADRFGAAGFAEAFGDNETRVATTLNDAGLAYLDAAANAVRRARDELDPGLGRVSRIASWLVRSGAQPDEDVGDGDRGRIPLSELVVAGRHRAELLAATHQPLDLVALPVAGSVEGQRPPTTGTLAGPVGLVVIPLGDGVRDVASAQRGPVGAAGVGLVGGQMIWSRAGPPAAAGPRHPHLVHQPDQLDGVGVLARGQPGRQVAATAIADRVELGGQPAA